MFKNFPFGGNKKFQFRLSAYNVFNHPQRSPTTPSNLEPDLCERRADERSVRVLPTDNKYGHRILQMAFKFYF